jgi:hypothetical protein
MSCHNWRLPKKAARMHRVAKYRPLRPQLVDLAQKAILRSINAATICGAIFKSRLEALSALGAVTVDRRSHPVVTIPTN